MAKRRRPALAGTTEQHERDLKLTRNHLYEATQGLKYALEQGNCVYASEAVNRGMLAIGAGHVHHDASTNMLGAGMFREYAEVKAFGVERNRFQEACLVKRKRRST